MAELLHRQLLSQARRLARLDPMRPKQGNLRRAVSSAYYALFHSLVHETCCYLLGTAADRRPYRHVLARAFQHDTMAENCRSFAGTTLPKSIQSRLPSGFAVPRDLRQVAKSFGDAQQKRHLADYDPAETFSRSEVLLFIADVEDAIDRLSRIKNLPETTFFFACLLTWGTLVRRK